MLFGEMPRQVPRQALLMVVLFGATALSAAVIPFSGTGSVAPTGPPDSGGNLTLQVLPGTAYTLGGVTGWQLTSTFTSNLGTGAGAGTFSFYRGADSLFGTITTAFGPAPGQFALTYLVQSGTGIYAGQDGTGSSIVQLLGDPNSPPTAFSETGSLQVVPEPATFACAGIGLAAIAAWHRRRRRVSV